MDYNLPYSINLAGKGDFEKALGAVNIFLTINNLNETSRKAGEYRQRCYQFALNYAATHPATGYRFDPTNMGDNINTAVSEYYPTVTIDGNTLIYNRRVNNFNEDFYESDRENGDLEKRPGACLAISTPTRTRVRRIFHRTGNG